MCLTTLTSNSIFQKCLIIQILEHKQTVANMNIKGYLHYKTKSRLKVGLKIDLDV